MGESMRQVSRLITAFLILWCSACQIAQAQDLKLNAVVTPTLSLGTSAVVQIDGLNAAIGSGAVKFSDFVLYLDGVAAANGAVNGLGNISDNKLAFSLKRTNDNVAAWTALLGSPTSFEKVVRLNVGLAGGKSLLPTTDGQPREVRLIVLWRWGLLAGIVFLIALLIALVKIGRASDLLRDRQPTDFGGAIEQSGGAFLRRPFSLAQSQMAWWFALTIGAYIFLFLVTGDVNTLTSQALILMGIGTATALGAAAVESTKTDPVQKNFQDLLARIAQLNAAGASQAVLSPLIAKRDEVANQLASKNFLVDTLTDANGVSLHRFQMLAWAVVIGAIFCFEVYRDLTLPAFDATILGILGISGGTYLGFKVPEQPV
jgi:hypothetical protein